MTQGELAGFLESMGISTDDIWTLCILLDTDKSGTIDLEEFVTGCMQLHGPAKSMQIAKMSYEQRRFGLKRSGGHGELDAKGL